MANEKTYPTWELLGLIIGFVGSANLVPELVNLVLNLYEKPDQFSRLFKISCIAIYLLILMWVAARHLYKINLPHSTDREEDLKKFTRTYRRLQILNFIRQFPLSLFNMLIFRFYKVFSYDLFKRHGEWPERPDLFNFIGRFRIEGKTIEIQYPRNFEALHVRETLLNSDSFGETQFQKWFSYRYRLLSMTTPLGVAWTINHILTEAKIFSRLLLLVGCLYAVGFILHLLDIFGLRLNFMDMNNLWRSWIIFLLLFDFIAAIGLFLKKWWGQGAFVLVAISQLVAYLKFSDVFGGQDFLIYFHLYTLIIYLFLKVFDLWGKNENRSSR